jgi:O-antigen ligase
VVAAFPGTLRLKLWSDESIKAATSGRGELIAGGYRVWERRPVTGWGAGAFEPQYRIQERVSGARAITASHTIPVTIAAEQGVIGLAVYLALLVAAFARLLPGARGSPLKAALSAAFAALVFHTWLYAAFLEDPLVWALLAIATAVGWQAAQKAPPPKKDKAPEDAATALARPG